MATLKYPLSNIQIELMKLFGTNLSDDELADLKKMLSNYFANKAIKAADELWDKQGMSDEDMDILLNKRSG
ncbi:hypothetical protein BDD43_3167 [Mucilaginibacter gracilis]|uniref:Uncharacterized protein n=1 Tax=Mucilaginibacter gracilis TaxID=423350 RepID=A0A495J3L8_9SPHI|nr:hypothetical protein [Mucilaginibacter gracilis]RKR82968.1 hypothetical protein BDD43_3167 [Mucilaginibacter gracilis]